MHIRTTLGLLVVVAVLVGVLLTTAERPEEAGNVSVAALGDHRLASAVRIRWQLHERQPVEIRREPGGPFRVTEPVEDLASLAVVRSIAQTYDSAQIGETPLPDTAEERRRLGLEPPRVVFEVEFEDGSQQRLEIGGEGPLGTDVFVRRDGVIYRGGLALFSSLQVPLNELRDRQVFRTPFPVARDITVDRARQGGGRQVLRLAQQESGWRLVEPIRARADAGAARRFVQQLLGLRIDQFAPGVVRFPEREPDIVVTVRGGAEDERVQLWIDEQDNLFGQIEGRKAAFQSENRRYYEIFQNAVDRLRARVMVPVGNVHEDLAAVIVDPGEGDAPRLRLQRQGPNQPWTMAEPVTGGADPTAVNQLLTAINNLRALEFHQGGVDDPRFGFGAERLRLGYQGTRETSPSFLRFGGTAELDAGSGAEGFEVVYAARTDALDEVVSVPGGAVDVMRRPWTEYVPREVLHVPQAPSRVVLQRRGGASRTIQRDDQGDWVDESGARQELVADIVERVRDLRGKRVLLARDAQLGEPDWTLALGRSRDDPGRHFVQLEVWERGELPLLVRGPGLPEIVHELSQLDSEALRRLWP